MKTLEKSLLIICILFLDYCSFSQPLRNDYIKFYDYNTLLNDLITHGKRSKYYRKLDYEAMLFLDKTCYKHLIKINPFFPIEQNIDTANIFYEVPEDYVNELTVNFTSIQQLFSSSDTWKNAILQSNILDIEDQKNMIIFNEIYIKDNQKAIITLIGEAWSIRYRIILRNNRLRFEELYVIQI